MDWEFLPNVCLRQLGGLIEVRSRVEVLSVAPVGGSALLHFVESPQVYSMSEWFHSNGVTSGFKAGKL